MQTLKSDKALIRGIAKVVINNKKDVIALINKYYKFDKKANTGDTVSFLLKKLAENKKFADEFAALMQKKKALIITNDEEYHGFVTALVTAVSGLASNIIGSQTAKRNQDMAKDNLTAEMLQALQEEKKAKAKKDAMQTAIIITGILSVVIIAGIVIYKN